MAEEVLASAGRVRREGLRLSAEELQVLLRRHSSTTVAGLSCVCI